MIEAPPAVGWVLLALVLALPLVYIIVHFTWGRKWVWPKGTRVESEYGGYKVTMVYGKGADSYFAFTPKTIARACALAAWSLGTCWNERREGKGRKPPKHVVVHVLDDEDYNATYDAPWAAYNIKSNGMLQYMGRRLGGGQLPVVACRARAFSSTPLTGSLVVHELTHYVGGDREHKNPNFWHPDENSLERAAQARHVSKREEIGIKV